MYVRYIIFFNHINQIDDIRNISNIKLKYRNTGTRILHLKICLFENYLSPAYVSINNNIR